MSDHADYMVENLVDRRVWTWGADQIVEVVFDPADGPLPFDIMSWTVKCAVGPPDDTESTFPPILAPTIDFAGKILVPITHDQSMQVPANVPKLRMGCWGTDTNGRKYDLFDFFLLVVKRKGRP